MASVIIPMFNGEKTIKKCIDSILNQKIELNYEVILVDDGSTDNTKNIIREKYGKNKKIKLIEQSHAGPAKARNLGAKKAGGEILVFTDSDCEAESNWLKEILKPFKNKNIAGVQGAYKTKQDCIIARYVQIEIEDRYEKMRKEKFVDWIGSYAAAYKKDIFIKLGGFDENFPSASGEDPDISYKMQERKLNLVFNQEAIVYHKHPESLFYYLKVKFYRAFYRIPLYNKHKQKIVKDSYTPKIMKFQIGMVYGIFLFSILSAFNILYAEINAVLLLIYIISLFPFTVFSLKKDLKVGIISPFIVSLRNIVFCFGLIAGILGVEK
ncbi:MAG: glycosyltransferase [Candidatus Diapherotrites archaeon]